MPIPFNQEALPEHLGYFTVTGSFLNALTQIPEPGSYETSSIRLNYIENPAPTSFSGSGWFASSGTEGIPETGWVGGIITGGTTSPYIRTPAVNQRGYAANTKVTLAIDYRVDAASIATHVCVLPHVRSTNTYYRNDYQVTRPINLGITERVVIQWVTPVAIAAGDLDIAVIVSNPAGTGTANANNGFSWRVRRPIIEDDHTDGIYFDGNTTNTEFKKYMWAGDPGNSLSMESSLSYVPASGRLQMRPIAGTVKFKPSIDTPITENVGNLTLVPTTITAHIDPDGRVIAPGDGKSSIPDAYEPNIKLLAPNQDTLSNTDWGWEVEVIPADGAYWMGFKMFIGSDARPGDMITLNEALVVDRDQALRPERVFVVTSAAEPYPFGFDPERDSLLITPALTYWRVTP